MARRKPMMGGMRGGMPMRDGMMGRGGKCQQYFYCWTCAFLPVVDAYQCFAGCTKELWCSTASQ